MRRTLALALAGGSLVAMASVAPATARTVAAPAVQSTTCDGSFIVQFRPGLTFSVQSQTIKASGSLSNCAGGGVASAAVIGKGSGSLSCTSGSATAKLKVRWDTGETSKVSVAIDVSNGTVSGTVVGGKFAGEDASGDLTLTPLTGNCITPVTKASAIGPVSL